MTLIKNFGSVIPNESNPTPVAMVIRAITNGRKRPNRLLNNVAIKHPVSDAKEAQTRVLPTKYSLVSASNAASSIYVQYDPILM